MKGKKEPKAPPAPRVYVQRNDPPPDPAEGRRVAAFSCPCGAQEEVREPAPARIDCWSCKRPQSMRRWLPRYDPPFSSARECTEAEFNRAFEERRAS